MWRVILLVFCYHVVSQPVADEPSTRHTRELIECCPCPESNHGGQNMLGRSPLGHASVDDCPCRLRNADSEGAPSMLFPSRTAEGNPFNTVPYMRSNDPNDIKNLLEPEVGLATSMLQTLHEATEEEYRDALARDAARSSDAVPEESVRNVVIIVNPRASDNEDDFVSEASNIKEARSSNPINTPLGKMRTVSKPLRTLPDFFRLPKARQPSLIHKNLWDSDINTGASNVQESLVNMDAGAARFQPSSSLFKFRTPLKENSLNDSINDFKTSSVFDKLQESVKNRPNLFERFNLPLVPKMRVHNPLRKSNNNISTKSDLSPAPSNIQKSIENEDGNGLFKLNKRPGMLKNLLKLKDVELIPKTIPKAPLLKSKLNTMKDSDLSTILNKDADDKCEDSTYDSAMNEKVLMPKKDFHTENKSINENNIHDGESSLRNNANDVIELEENRDDQDALTSPSEIMPNVFDNAQTKNLESDETDCSDLFLEVTTTKTITKVLEDVGLNEEEDPEFKYFTINEVGGDASKSCETGEVSETQTESSEPEIDSKNNIENMIPSTFQDSENSISLPQLQKSEQDTVKPTDENSEDFTGIRQAEDKQQSSELSSELISNKLDTNNKPISPLSETLFSIKDNVRKSLENLKKTQNAIPAFSQRNSKSSNQGTDPPYTENLDDEPQKDEPNEATDDSKSKLSETVDQVTFNDLQKLSNDLLVSSSNNQQSFMPKQVDELSMIDFKSNEEHQTDETESDSFGTPLTTLFNEATPNSNLMCEQNVLNKQADESSEPDFKPKKAQKQTGETEPGYFEAEPTTLFSVEMPNSNPTKGKACNVGFDNSKPKTVQQLKSVIQNDIKDMSVEGSAPIVNTLAALLDPLNSNKELESPLYKKNHLDLKEKLGSSLIPNLDALNINEKLRSPVLDLNKNIESLLQPNLDPLNVRSSLQNYILTPAIPDDPLNFFGKPIAEVLKLPTLEDLRQRLSTVFDANDRSAENNFSDEDGDYTNDNPIEMLPAASTYNLRKVPSLKPLEDMNVDIFQLNPLSKPDVFSSPPRFNLNNFRAKLPIPNNLDLKPVKLESRVGNNKGNLLGASLTFGNDKATLRKPKPSYSNLLGHSLGSLPNLDEFRTTLHSGAQNLLSTPLHSNANLFKDSNFRASGIPDIDEVRRNAEKTVKGLQQRMKSTFKTGKNNTPLTEKFAKPQDLLEDFNDKIKAIHYDFNDRLSSIHEDILDNSKLKSLAIPLHPTFLTNRNSNHNIVNNIRKTKGKPSRLQTSASTISSQEINPFQTTKKLNLLRPSGKSGSKGVHTDTHSPVLGAESSPLATKVEFPKPKTAIDVPEKSTLAPLSHVSSSRQGSESLFPQNIRAKPLGISRQPSLIKDLKRPILRKPSPFKDKTSKVTITFATTTSSPVTEPMDKLRTTSVIKADKPNIQKSLKERLALPTSKSLDNKKQSASLFTPSRISTPIKSKDNFKTANSNIKDLPQFQSLGPIGNTISLPSFKDSKLRLNENNANRLNSVWAFDNNKPESKNVEVVMDETKARPLVWPKSGEDSFLTKVREAMQARLDSFNPTKAVEPVKVLKVESPSTEMMRSASENHDVIVEEPLKENVSYKCRMVCTREK